MFLECLENLRGFVFFKYIKKSFCKQKIIREYIIKKKFAFLKKFLRLFIKFTK